MNGCEFYRVLLGLEKPWEVREVAVDAEKQKVDVTVGYKEGTLWACPESRERLPVHDHVERRWRHLVPLAETRAAEDREETACGSLSSRLATKSPFQATFGMA